VLYRKTIIMQEAGNAYRLADWQAPDTAEKPHHLLSPSNEQPVDECYARTLRPWTDTDTGKAIREGLRCDYDTHQWPNRVISSQTPASATCMARPMDHTLSFP
jgi:hypothetical protein